MKLLLPLALLASSAVAHPHHDSGDWNPPGHDDFRGPCPMMNTLANHGYLPRDGRNITRVNAISALGSALNFNASLASLMFDMAIVANPEPNATFFTLDHLNRHNVLEHDGSLSRKDAYFGNNHVFDEDTFDQTKSYWTAQILDANMIANGKMRRQLDSKAFNPTYRFTDNTENFSLGEMAAPIIAFGDMDLVTVNRSLVEYFFENERLPTELGWEKKKQVINVDEVLKISSAIAKAASLITGDPPTKSTRGHDLHAGFKAQV